MKANHNYLFGIAALAVATSAQAQNVGIGTTTPQSKLSVDGTTASGGIAVGDASYISTPGTIAPLNGAIIQGDVGIGGTVPDSKLHVRSEVLPQFLVGPEEGTSASVSVNRHYGMHARGTSGGAFFGYMGAGQNPTGPTNGSAAILAGTGKDIAFFTEAASGAGAPDDPSDPGNVNRMTIARVSGNVGIGTPTPLAPLHVLENTGTTTRGAGDVRQYHNTGIGSVANEPAVNVPGVSIYANGRIVSGDLMMARGFQAAQSFTASDERTKDIIGVTDSAIDLETLKKLQITDYTMKDKSLLGDKPFKKVIAQEVEEVFSQAVSKTEKAIPDVMQAGTAKEISEGRFQVSLADATDLKTGEFVEIFDKDRTPQVVRVESVEENTITVALRSVKEGEEVFVYGRHVDDFGIVDYEALSMLHISATQELAKKVAALEVENERLKADNAKLAVIAAEVKALKETVTVIRRQNETTARTVSITR